MSRPIRRFSLVGLWVALFASSTACAPDSTEVVAEEIRTDQSSDSGPVDIDEGEPGNPLLAVEAPLVGGGSIELSVYSGRPLALWFWAPG